MPTPRPGLTPAQQAAELHRQDVIEKVRIKLGTDIASALAAQDQLTSSLEMNVTQSSAILKRTEQSRAKAKALQAQITKLDGRITSTEQRLQRERALVRALAREMYVQPSSLLVQLSQAPNLGQVLIDYADTLSAAERASSVKASLAADSSHLRSDRQALASAQAQEREVNRILSTNLLKLAALQAQQHLTSSQLSSQIAAFKAELKSIDKQSPELAQQVSDLLEQEQNDIVASAMQAVWNQLETLAASDVAVGDLPNNPLHSKKHRFIWPEPHAQISQAFGPTPYSFEPPYLSYPHFHAGLDLADSAGTTVLAADDGVVILTGDSKVNGEQVGYGNFVAIAHPDGVTTLYAHLAVVGVKVGDRVKQAQPIGLEGSTGNSTGPHCHFEIRIDGQFVDPTPFLPPGPSADRS